MSFCKSDDNISQKIILSGLRARAVEVGHLKITAFLQHKSIRYYLGVFSMQLVT